MNNKSLTILFMTTALTGCGLAPELPNVLPESPAAYKEAPAEMSAEEIQGSWKLAEPSDAVSRGEWWKIFGDATLDDLVSQATDASQSLKAASARLLQSRAALSAQESILWPSLDVGGDVSRQATSAASLGLPAGSSPRMTTLYRARGTVSYETDLLGGNWNSVRASRFDSEAQEAAYASVLLALQAEVAERYFSLRALDEEIRALRETANTRESSARVMEKRQQAGFSNDIDLSREQAELASVKAQLAATEQQRALQEHALAVVLGKTPAEFSFPDSPLDTKLIAPVIPAGIPSSLLERRPDIASAQRSMAAANERIGLARAAFFPKLSLTIFGGYESQDLSDLFKWSSRTWMLGPQFGPALSMPIFDGGRNLANLDLADARYQESAADYRQQVLVAFREVEDSLSDIRQLSEQQTQVESAAKSAKRAADLSRLRYDNGDLNYLDVVDAERSQLSAERARAQVAGQRFIATISLIRALGGSWQMPAAPAEPTPSPQPTEEPSHDQEPVPQIDPAVIEPRV